MLTQSALSPPILLPLPLPVSKAIAAERVTLINTYILPHRSLHEAEKRELVLLFNILHDREPRAKRGLKAPKVQPLTPAEAAQLEAEMLK